MFRELHTLIYSQSVIPTLISYNNVMFFFQVFHNMFMILYVNHYVTTPRFNHSTKTS